MKIKNNKDFFCDFCGDTIVAKPNSICEICSKYIKLGNYAEKQLEELFRLIKVSKCNKKYADFTLKEINILYKYYCLLESNTPRAIKNAYKIYGTMSLKTKFLISKNIIKIVKELND